MKKHLGKIILCTTLALATPFALIGCSKKAANNQTPDNNEQGQEQQQNAIQYGYAYNGEGTVTPQNYTEAREVKVDLLTDIIGGADDEETLNALISQIPDNIVNVSESKKYVVKLPATAIDEEAYKSTVSAYAAQYENKTPWVNMNTKVENAEGVYFISDANAERDLLMSVDYHFNGTEDKNVTIYMLSFAPGSISDLLQSLGNNN